MIGALAVLMLAAIGPRPATTGPISPNASGDIAGAVVDSVTAKPLSGGEVRITQGGAIVATTTTDPFGRFVVHNLSPGTYLLEIRYLGYRPASREVSVTDTGAGRTLDVRLVPIPINLEAVEVQAAVPLSVDTRTGNQIFKQNDYHGAPTNTTSQIL